MIRALLFILLTSCSLDTSNTIRVAATSVPHGEMLAFIKPEMAERGVNLEIIEVSDYQLPNRLLAEGEVDANFFQHISFLVSQKEIYGSKFCILASVHEEPLGLYSTKLTSLYFTPDATIAIPNDIANQSRALRFLASLNLISLKQTDRFLTLNDVTSTTPYLQEVDAPYLARCLPDVTAAVIPGNFALQAHLSPCCDALALENPDPNFVNILVVRTEDKDRPALLLLAELLTSDKMHCFLKEKYQGAIHTSH